MTRRSIVPDIMKNAGMAGVVDAINKLEGTIKSTASYLYADNETPSGVIDGSNKVFTLADSPDPDLSLKLYLNGEYQAPAGENYTLSGITINFIVAPPVDSILRAFYRYK